MALDLFVLVQMYWSYILNDQIIGDVAILWNSYRRRQRTFFLQEQNNSQKFTVIRKIQKRRA
jgi:hypothetical protein